MTITPEQFRAAFPSADQATVHTLFAETGCKRTHLGRALEHHGLDAPHVATQFLAVCGLLSKGFTDFTTRKGERIEAQSPDVWLWSQARRWDGNRDASGLATTEILTDAAHNWEFDYLCLQTGVTNAHGNRLHGWRTLQSVCAALGVEYRLEMNQGETLPKSLGGLYVDVRPDGFLSIGQSAALPHKRAATN